MLTVCVSSTDTDLATTGDVMLVLYGSTTTGNVATTQEINYLGTLVRRASAWAEAYVGYPLTLQTYSESLGAQGDRRLVVSRTPLVSVLRLFDSTATCEATSYASSEYLIEDRAAGFIARNAGFAWTQLGRANAGDFNLGLVDAVVPGMEERPWLIEYVAGYKLACSTSTAGGLTTADEAWTTGQTLPDYVVQAVALRAAGYQANPLGVVSRRVGDLAVDYGTAGPSGQAEDLLALHRRVF